MGAFLFKQYCWNVFEGFLDQVKGVGLDDL
jgi:hypothetical protein